MGKIATTTILVGMFGAVLQELIYWYGLRSSLTTTRYKRLMASAPYWIVTVLMVVGAGVGTWIWYEGGQERTLREYCLTGAAFPLILKKAISAFGDKGPTLGSEAIKTLGSPDGGTPRESTLWDYFKAG